MTSTAVIPQPVGSQFVELGRQRSGSLFDKHILSAGPLIHPKTGATIDVTPDMLDRVVANFNSNVCPIVQVPLANDRNQHSEDPARNTGEVLGLRREGRKLIATMDIRDKQAAAKIRQGLILGSSAFLHLDYTDTRTGRKVGPALLHNCLTNRPYVVDLEPFQEIAASSGLGGEVVMLSYSDGDPAMPDSDELTLTQDDLDAAYAELAQNLGRAEYVIRDEVAALAGLNGTSFPGWTKRPTPLSRSRSPGGTRSGCSLSWTASFTAILSPSAHRGSRRRLTARCSAGPPRSLMPARRPTSSAWPGWAATLAASRPCCLRK